MSVWFTIRDWHGRKIRALLHDEPKLTAWETDLQKKGKLGLYGGDEGFPDHFTIDDCVAEEARRRDMIKLKEISRRIVAELTKGGHNHEQSTAS